MHVAVRRCNSIQSPHHGDAKSIGDHCASAVYSRSDNLRRFSLRFSREQQQTIVCSFLSNLLQNPQEKATGQLCSEVPSVIPINRRKKYVGKSVILSVTRQQSSRSRSEIFSCSVFFGCVCASRRLLKKRETRYRPY